MTLSYALCLFFKKYYLKILGKKLEQYLLEDNILSIHIYLLEENVKSKYHCLSFQKKKKILEEQRLATDLLNLTH